jgi:hypothetical protein
MSRRIERPFIYVTQSKLLLSAGAVLLLIILGAMMVLYIGRNFMSSLPPAQDVLATIRNSGSTNTPGWTLTINKDGSGTITYDHTRRGRFGHYEDKTFAAGTFASSQLEAILTQIGNVSSIPDHGCPKSASFGSTTTITYQGKTSGDLTCLSQKDPPMFLDLKHLVQNLPINTQPGGTLL